MKKLMNDAYTIENDMFSGYAELYKDKIERIANTGIFVSRTKKKQVAVISGGGSGHEPADVGYVGEGLLQACAMGPVFIPPNAEDVYKAIKAADQGLGVFVIVKNFEADVKSFMLGIDLALNDGHEIEYAIVNDDCSVESDSYKKRRRGVAGTVLAIKVLGAAAFEGKNLKELKELSETLILSINTLGVSLAPGILPTEKNPMFELSDEMVSYGVGIHGESGYRQEDYHSSAVLAVELWNKLKSQGDLKKDDEVAILVNGMGATPQMELMVFYNDLRQLVELDNVKISFVKIGNFMTSLDMKGVSVSCLKIKDPMWISYLNMEVDGFGW